jgi:tetratricopeptide (TPR) repeat protein
MTPWFPAWHGSGTFRRLLPLVPLAAAVAQTPEQLIEAGHWKRARAMVDAGPGCVERNPAGCFLLSQIRNAFGDRKTPLALAEKAVSFDGKVARFHRQLAEALGVAAQSANPFQQLFLARRFKREIQLALGLDGRDLQAQRDLMEFYLLAPGIAGGDRSRAQEVAGGIARFDASRGFLAEARLAEFDEPPDRVAAMLRKAVEADNASYRARIAMAQFWLEAGHENADEAARQAGEAIRIDPGRVDGYAVLAEADAMRTDGAALDALMARAAESVPDDLAPYYRAAARQLAAGRDLARARRYLEKYLSQEPEGNEPTLAEAHWKLGEVLEKLGELPVARKEWREAARLDPESGARDDLRRAGN